MWPHPADNEANTAWVRSYYDGIAPHSEPGGYVNFLSDDDAARRPDSYGANYERLKEVKGRYECSGGTRTSSRRPFGDLAIRSSPPQGAVIG
jgi:hypothetical protein